jgi:hypothetical protein
MAVFKLLKANPMLLDSKRVLRSRHFRGNRRLEDCLVSDPAHVTSGQRGEHVSLIQYALLRLQVSAIEERELRQKEYGKTTADAVLKFKKSFDIVNRSYQTTPDKIVGKMTIAALDEQIWGLEGFNGPPRQQRAVTPYHPPTPLPTITGHPTLRQPSLTDGNIVRTSWPASPIVKASGVLAERGFESPLADLPMDLQFTILHSNEAKVPGDLMLYPFIANHEGPLPGKELSKRFAAQPVETEVLRALHGRMNPFGIFAFVKYIHNTFQGTGSRGFAVDLEDEERAFQYMVTQTFPKTREEGVTDAPFCRDAWNVHGARDSFREIVPRGEGLHICITQPPQRGSLRNDFHIDNFQQGSVCFNGYCVPLVNRQTAEHVLSVGPWLVKEGSEKRNSWNLHGFGLVRL